MDIDREPVNGKPSSPAPAPAPQFSVPVSNGAPSPMNIDSDGPAPPPHKSAPSSPVPSPAEEAESFKAAGNKLFKEKEYNRAVDEYTKGMSHQSPPSGDPFSPPSAE